MRKILLASSLAILTLISYSQTSILEVISPAGGFFQNSNISISWTLGEPVIETWVNQSADIMVTSGFQQGDFTVTSVPENPMAGFIVQMFPNPAKQEAFIKVTLPALGQVNITVLDVTGRTIIQEMFNPATLEHTHPLNVSSLRSGIYLVRIHSGAKLVKVLKLIKE